MNKDDMLFSLLTNLDHNQEKMRESMVRMEADLKYHIRRTDLLESALDQKVEEMDDKIDLIVLSTKIDWKGISIKVGILATLIGIISTIYTISK